VDVDVPVGAGAGVGVGVDVAQALNAITITSPMAACMVRFMAHISRREVMTVRIVVGVGGGGNQTLRVNVTRSILNKNATP
jgi:hypothetical protein